MAGKAWLSQWRRIDKVILGDSSVQWLIGDDRERQTQQQTKMPFPFCPRI
jgi:hypothetical protein